MEHTTEKRLTKFSEKSYNGNPKCPTGSRTLHRDMDLGQPGAGFVDLTVIDSRGRVATVFLEITGP